MQHLSLAAEQPSLVGELRPQPSTAVSKEEPREGKAMPPYEIVGLSCLGGILPDFLRIIAARYDGPPKYLRSLFFWISLFLLILLAGGTALLVKPTGTVDALAVGFGAPEIISKLLSRPADRGNGKTSLVADLRSWWAV